MVSGKEASENMTKKEQRRTWKQIMTQLSWGHTFWAGTLTHELCRNETQPYTTLKNKRAKHNEKTKARRRKRRKTVRKKEKNKKRRNAEGRKITL